MSSTCGKLSVVWVMKSQHCFERGVGGRGGEGEWQAILQSDVDLICGAVVLGAGDETCGWIVEG